MGFWRTVLLSVRSAFSMRSGFGIEGLKLRVGGLSMQGLVVRVQEINVEASGKMQRGRSHKVLQDDKPNPHTTICQNPSRASHRISLNGCGLGLRAQSSTKARRAVKRMKTQYITKLAEEPVFGRHDIDVVPAVDLSRDRLHWKQ